MRSTLGLALLVACSEEEPGGKAFPEQAGPPVQMMLVAPTHAVAGEVVTVRVWDAPPGQRVSLGGSRASGGAPVCPPTLGGSCTGLSAPVVALGAGVADAAGAATFSVRLPTTLPPGSVRLQALAVAPTGQGSLSQVHTVTVLGLAGDPDGDGLTTAAERAAGTDPARADSDRGGLADGVDVDPRWADDDLGASPVVGLPGDLGLAPPVGVQGRASAARGGGVTLVVWEDSRAGASGAPQYGSQPVDVLAQRFDDSGAPLDPHPVVLDAGVMKQGDPDVAFNGQSFLVVWSSRRPVGEYGTTTDVLAARLLPDGTLLDGVPLGVGVNPVQEDASPVVASDGAGFVVAWRAGIGFGVEGILAAPVDAAGGVGAPSALWQTVGGVGFYVPFTVDIAWAAGRYLVVGSHLTPGVGGDDVYGRPLGADALPLGPEVQLTSAVSDEYASSLASDGATFALAWYDEAGWGEVRASPLSPTGGLAVPGGAVVAAGLYGTLPTTAIGHDGSGWVVAYDPGGALQVARLTAGGALRAGSPFGVSASTASMFEPVVVGDGAGARVLWSDQRLTSPSRLGSQDLWSARVSAGGAVGPEAPLLRSPPAGSHVDIAGPVGGAWLAVFVSETTDERRLMAQRFDVTGAALDAAPIALHVSTGYLTRPAVAHDGQRWLVAFEDQGNTWFVRVDAAGTPLDPSPVLASPGGWPDVAALGDTFLVVSQAMPGSSFQFLDIRGRRVRGVDGALLDPSALYVHTGFVQNAAVVAAGDRWLVAGQAHATHDSAPSSIVTRVVWPDGSLAAGTVGSSATPYNRTPAMAWSGAEVLLTWSDGTAVRGRRVLADGAGVDAPSGFVLGDAMGEQLLPDVAWDGASWRVVWHDTRAEGSAQPVLGLGDVYTAAVWPDGTVDLPAGWAVAADPARLEVMPTVAASAGHTWAAWTAMDPVLATPRVELREVP